MPADGHVGTVEVDDAVGVERLPDGRRRLWVHIADPSRYVPLGSAVDLEARREEKRPADTDILGHDTPEPSGEKRGWSRDINRPNVGLCEEILAAGGNITVDDLRSYRPIFRAPLQLTVGGMTLLGVPPPSSGGATEPSLSEFQ